VESVQAAEAAGDHRLLARAVVEDARLVGVGHVERDDPVLRQFRTRDEQGGRCPADEEVGDAPLRRGEDADLARPGQLRQRDFVVGLVVEPAPFVEEDLEQRPLTGARDDDDIGPAVAVDVAEGGRGGADVPRGHDYVLPRDAEVQARPLRLDQAPAARDAHLDAGAQRVRRAAGGAVAGQHHVGPQRLQLA
jgi:hypothetical protein